METSDNNVKSDTFVEHSNEEIQELLEDSKSKNTKRSTNTALNRLRSYLQSKQMPILEEICDADLPELLTNFYTAARTKKQDLCTKLPALK